MDPDAYLRRIGIDPRRRDGPSLDDLARLQHAHVTSVPFETLAITGHPFGSRQGQGVDLDLAAIYEKVVEDHRGGFCYELNGLFGWLLAELGYDVERVVGAVLLDGEPRPPANHLTSLVTVDEPYVADVGLGVPSMRQPLPLEGGVVRDETDVTWRRRESDRPDAEYVVQFRMGEASWTDRYVLQTVPRELSYVEATCEYLTSAPESPFTGDPVVCIGTERGFAKLSPTELTRVVHGKERTEAVDADGWTDALEATFGISGWER